MHLLRVEVSSDTYDRVAAGFLVTFGGCRNLDDLEQR